MPLYDFRCPKCGLEFEVSRPMSRATDPALCPQDSTESERVYRAPPLIVGRGGSSALESGDDGGGGLGGFGGDDHDHGHSHGPGGHSH
jgi:putative FmdB family regulatory protein